MKCQTVQSFQNHLEASSPQALSRVYLIAIPDDFERKKWLNVLASLIQGPDQSKVCLSAVDASLEELFTAIDSPSLFDPQPTLLIDEVEKLSKKQAQGIIERLQKGEFGGHLILGSRAKSAFYSVVEKAGVVFDLCEEKSWEKEKRLSQTLFEKARQAGKKFSTQACQALLERVDKELSLLENEMDKLICYVGEKSSIEIADVLAIVAPNRTQTMWQMAEEMIWEGKIIDRIDESSFHGLVPALRFQLQLGLKIASMLDARASFSEISSNLPKIWPKTLEKRLSQASQVGSFYFQKGLQLLFKIEMISRSQSSDLSTLLDFFRVSFIKMGK